MEELQEIPPFLTHENPKVRLQACQIIMGFSQSKQHQIYFRTMKPPIIPRMRSILTDDDADVAKCAVKSLVNLAEDAGVRNLMIDCGTINVVMTCLKKKSDPNIKFHVMLLQNLTIEMKGAEKFSGEGTALEGLNTRLLLQWLTDRERESLPGDPLQYFANVLCNVTVCTSTRKLITDPSRDMILKDLKQQFKSRSPVRRLGTLSAIKNLFRDHSSHDALLSEDLGLFADILLLIVGPEDLDDDDTATFLADVLVEMGSDKKRCSSKEVRRTVLDIIDICCTHKPSRVYLKSIGTYCIVRELHKFERDQDHPGGYMEELDDFIESNLVQFLCRPEEGETPLATGPQIEEITNADGSVKGHASRAKKPVDPEEALGNDPNAIPVDHPGLMRF